VSLFYQIFNRIFKIFNPKFDEMYSFKKIGIVVDNTEIDEKIYKACKMMNQSLLDIQEIHIIHTVKQEILPLQDAWVTEDIKEVIALNENELRANISQNASQILGNQFKDKLSVHILNGTPIDVILNFQKETPMDIFIGGKKKDKSKSGRFVKDLIRSLSIPVMMIPEDIPEDWSLKSILVPYDYSEFSDKALKSALAIQEKNTAATIECLHLINSPAFSSGSMVSSEKIIRYMEEDRQMEFEAKMEELKIDKLPKFKIQVFDKFPGQEIQKRSVQGDFSLIVMGAKGHSILQRFFIGSVTEKVIALNDSVPLLVVE
jgi:nucleotide-binding universal stress UspA family protein